MISKPIIWIVAAALCMSHARAAELAAFIDGPLPKMVAAARAITNAPPAPSFAEGEEIALAGIKGDGLEVGYTLKERRHKGWEEVHPNSMERRETFVEVDVPRTVLVPADATDFLSRVKLRVPQPTHVTLSQPAEYPVMSGERQVGKAVMRAGAEVELLTLDGTNVVVSAGGNRARIPVTKTDYDVRRAALRGQRDRYAAKASNAQAGAAAASPAKRLEFRGIRLGMRRAEMEALVRPGVFGYVGTHKPGEAFSFLYADNAPGSFNVLAEEGVPGKVTTYWWTRTGVSFFRDRVAEISVSGPPVTANKIDPDVLDWCSAVRAVLIAKYGNPTREPLAVRSVNILSFKEGYSVFLSRWEMEGQEVRLSISTSDHEYKGEIEMVDTAVARQIKEETTVKANF